jgi:hypothetical protein
MSTTLHDHPPQREATTEVPRLTSRRPTPVERLALRVGLLLITYGRRRYASTSGSASCTGSARACSCCRRDEHGDRMLRDPRGPGASPSAAAVRATES